MNGPDFKVGKTDVINNQGHKVTTETTLKQTSNGNSIWTVKKQVDYDNDGVADMLITSKNEYDSEGKLINYTSEQKGKYDNVDINNKTQKKNVYESQTGNLVKTIEKEDRNGDGITDNTSVTKYSYNKDGSVVIKEDYDNDGKNDTTTAKDKKGRITEYTSGNKSTTIEYDDKNKTATVRTIRKKGDEIIGDTTKTYPLNKDGIFENYATIAVYGCE